LEEALMDCGVLPDDPLEYDSYSDPYDYDRERAAGDWSG
jgi:hypothetical protein